MKIILIERKRRLGNAQKILSPYGQVLLIDKKEKGIEKYTELLSDDEKKVLGIAPANIDYTLPTEFLKKVKNLKGIVTKSSWARYIDLEYCKKNNIVIANSPGANSQAVAEYAIWQMLCLARKLPIQLEQKFKTNLKDKTEGTEMKGKTMGIVGLGRIGSKIADIGKGVGMKVIYWNRSKKKSSHKSVSLNTLLKTSDCIFKCVETCKETNDLLNKNNLKLLKKNVYFISVFGGIGWGGEDEYILLDMAEKGRIGGFSIENDHKKGAKVKKSYKGNVFIPAAHAWHTKETHNRYNKIWADGIIGIINDKKINRVV